jgi:hypothetical protein
MSGRGIGRQWKKGQSGNMTGRPQRRRRDDPNCYKLVEFLYHVAKGKTPDFAAQLVAWIEDAYIGPAIQPRVREGKVLVWRHRPHTPRAPATFPGRGRTFQKQVQKYREASREDALWFQTMVEMLLLADVAHSTHDKAVIFELAEKIGETDYYTHKIAPMIDGRNAIRLEKAIAG